MWHGMSGEKTEIFKLGSQTDCGQELGLGQLLPGEPLNTEQLICSPGPTIASVISLKVS